MLSATRVNLLLFLLTACVSAEETLQVRLRDKSNVNTKVVSLSDVATISGGSLIPRRTVADLDIVALEEGVARRVSKRQIEMRILLAGHRRSQFRVVGKDSIVVERSPVASPEQQIVQFLKSQLSDRLGIATDDLELKLSRPLPQHITELFRGGPVSLTHSMGRKTRVGPGSATLQLATESEVKSLAVQWETEVFRDVMVAARALSLGEVISERDFEKQRRLVDHATLRNLASVIVGKQARRRVEAGTVLTTALLRDAKPEKKEAVIRARDIIEIVAQRPGLQARVAGAVALQRGAVGDTIRVKNPSSGRVLNGEVVSPGLVRIRL